MIKLPHAHVSALCGNETQNQFKQFLKILLEWFDFIRIIFPTLCRFVFFHRGGWNVDGWDDVTDYTFKKALFKRWRCLRLYRKSLKYCSTKSTSSNIRD
jgi:hypothetical protein